MKGPKACYGPPQPRHNASARKRDFGAQMIFAASPLGSGPGPARSRGVRSLVATALLGLLMLAGCGGGTTQADPFEPRRLLVFGDDTSTIAPNGAKYNVNGLNAGNVPDCSLEPIWVQSLAAQYGFVFAECNPGSLEPKAFMRAGVGAQVADVAAQVEAQVAAGGFRDKDLATVLAGTNDVLALYAQYPSRSVPSLLEEARARGKRLAQVVNRLVGLGVKVVVSDLPDIGLSPFALAQKALDPTGLDRCFW
jgi:outer membrane lipase/esterase